MIELITIIFIIVGILGIIAFPKILMWALFGIISYLTITTNLYWAIAYIPLFLLIIYFKKRRNRDG